MFKRILLAVVVVAFSASTTFAQQTCGTNPVNNPPIFEWTDMGDYKVGTLVMTEATLDINGETLTTRVYAQEGGPISIPGPTLIMTPGERYVMQFKNLLPEEPINPEHNIFKDPNVTNVHTHGVHISGESPGDDVTRAFPGQWGGDYLYDIPTNHMGGTFWYHAHHHGSTFLQVSSGAFGLIIIDDAGDGMPANVAAMQEQHLLLGYLEPGNAAGTGGDTLISGSFSNGWTLNGAVNGDVCIPQDTWQHWRMLVADQDARLVDLEIGDGCEVQLMARDGVWRTQIPKAIPDGTLTLTGASRADLAVRCSSDSTISVGGVRVANVLVDAPPSDPSTVHPYRENGESSQTQWSADRPGYLRDLRGGIPDDSETIRMGARSVLGRKFDMHEPNLVKEATGIQEWSLNGATNHPFHLHIYHVQVQSDCGPFEAGEFYDVIAGNCDLRFDMSAEEAYDGRTIFHCHILQHEDQGAMGWMQVTGSNREAPASPPAGFDDLYRLGGPPPPTGPAAPTGLSATPVTSDSIDLAWTDNSDDEEFFVIERDSQLLPGTLPAGTTTYTDTGLDPSTTYTYRVAASNIDGDSYSAPSSATTLTTGGTPTSVEVASITLATVSEGKGVKSGQATIVVADNLGNPVSNALVSGYFVGDLAGTASQADTGSDDTVTVFTENTAKKVRSLEFCVTAVAHSTLADFSGDLCGSL